MAISNTVASAAIQRLLHENWNPVLAQHLQVSAPEMELFKWTNQAPEGKHWEETAQTAGNAYMAARSSDSDEWLPGYDPSATADDAISGIATAQAQYKVKELYQAVDFTTLMKEITNSPRTGFKNLAALKFQDVLKHLKFMMSVRLAGTALGTVAKIKSVNTGTGVVELYNQSANIPEGGNRYIKVGHVMDAANQGRSAALRTAGAGDRGRRVTAVSLNNVATSAYPTVTFNSLTGCTWADGDFLLMYNTRQTGAVDTSDEWQSLKNPWGILDVADDGTYCPFIGGVTRSSNPSYKAVVSDTGSLHDPTLDELNLLVEQIDTEWDGTSKWFYCHPSHRRFLMAFLTATVGVASGSSGTETRSGPANENPTRYNNPGAEKVRVGYGDVEIMTLGPNGSMPVKTSRLAPMHSIFAFDDDTLKTLNLKEPGFMKADGLTVRKAHGKATYYADYEWLTGGIISEHHGHIGVLRSINGSPVESP